MTVAYTIKIVDAYCFKRELKFKAKNEKAAIALVKKKYPKCAITDIQSRSVYGIRHI